MTRVVLTFGILAGLIIAALTWIVAWLIERDMIHFDRLAFVGYGSMLIALTMVFFGIKSFRDRYGNGTITFWKAVQVGLLISVIAGVIYYVGAESYNIVNPGFQAKFMKEFTDQKIGKLKQEGAPPEKLAAAQAEVDMMQSLFNNPLGFLAIAMIEILPVGMIVTLISALLLRRREVLPATA